MKKRKAILGVIGGIVALCIICVAIGIVYSSTPTNIATATAELIAKAVLTSTAETKPTQNNTPSPMNTPTTTETPALSESPTLIPSPTSSHNFLPLVGSSAAQTLEAPPIPAGESYSCIPANTERTEARVTRVVDGDTIQVEINGQAYRLRYIGMDTSENTTKKEFFGAEATARNKELVEGKTVLLVKDVSETDRYDRLLRYVFIGDIFVNYELVRQGFATSATYPPDVACTETFLRAERVARDEGLGLWASTEVSQPDPASQPEATAQTSASDSVAITSIFYDGDVPRVESDEYAEITNNGSETVNLSSWRLNAGAPGQDFRFPSFNLEPGKSCRVYTDENHPETCGFSFRSEQAIWNNNGDCGYLYNEAGEQVSEYCY